MEKSIKQITKSFETFATAHKNIAQYTNMMSAENTAKNWLYPLMFVAQQPATLQNGEILITMDCYFLDQGDEEDYVNKTSSMLKLCEDFLTYFSKNEQTYGFYLDDTAIAEPVIMAFEDSLIGYKMPITVKVKSSQNEYKVPV
jgi:hypothetical protein